MKEKELKQLLNSIYGLKSGTKIFDVDKITEDLGKCMDKKCSECKYQTNVDCRNRLIEDAVFVIRRLIMKQAIRCKVKLGNTVKHREEKDAYFIKWFERGSNVAPITNIKALVIIADTKQVAVVDPEDICFVDLPFTVFS